MSKFEVRELPWLYAAGDTVQLIVWRSLIMDPSDRRYAPVADFISEHGLLLQEREVQPSDDHLFGRVEKSYFVNAELRHLLALQASGALDA